MNNRKLQKENLDEISRNLLKSARANREEIENLLANPRLFEAVKTRIQIEKQTRQPHRNFSNWTTSAFLNLPKAIAALAILLALISFAAALIFRTSEKPQIAERQIESKTVSEQPKQSGYSTPIAEIKKTRAVENKTLPRAAQIAFKTEKAKSVEVKLRRSVVKQDRTLKNQSPEVFYSLGFEENWDKNSEDLRIVRAEISRAQLFALGMNLTVENEAAEIKTDLLVGADGIARAIRFVE